MQLDKFNVSIESKERQRKRVKERERERERENSFTLGDYISLQSTIPFMGV